MPFIAKIHPCQIDEAKCAIRAVWRELMGNDSRSEVRTYAENKLTDLNDIETNYFLKGGTFLVIIDKTYVVGTGAILPINTTTCELKRMYLLEQYRGRGLG